MNANSENKKRRTAAANWIAAGFLVAFVASVLTVLYTGLMVEGTPSEFHAGFRSMTFNVGEMREVEFLFEAESASPDARLELSLPPGIVAPADGRLSRPVAVAAGSNRFSLALSGTGPGQGYVVARLIDDEPIALDRVFVTIVEVPAD